jgi:hypothetical protein
MPVKLFEDSSHDFLNVNLTTTISGMDLGQMFPFWRASQRLGQNSDFNSSQKDVLCALTEINSVRWNGTMLLTRNQDGQQRNVPEYRG